MSSEQQYADVDGCENCSSTNYLDGNPIWKWFTKKPIRGNILIHDCVTFAYITTLAIILDKWIRTSHKRKLWHIYLEIGRCFDYWVPQVSPLVQKADDKSAKLQLIQEKINEFHRTIHSLIADYMKCSRIFKQHRTSNDDTQTIRRLLALAGLNNTDVTFPDTNFDDTNLKLEKYVRDYIMTHNRSFRRSIRIRIQTAKREAVHFHSLKHFMEMH